MKTLSYILFVDGHDPDTLCIGFNKYNTPGYIDHGPGWSEQAREEFHIRLEEEIGSFLCYGELNCFTYQVHKLEGLEGKLKALGIKKMEAEWLE